MLQYEPRVGILQHGYEYAPLNTACWPDWLPTETLVLPQTAEPSIELERVHGGGGVAERRQIGRDAVG